MPNSLRRKILILFFTMLAGTLSASDAEIRIKSDAVINGPLVLLGDIAEVEGSDALQIESLKKLELFPAPAPGRLRAVRSFELRQLLALHGFDTQAMHVSGAGFAHVASSPRISASVSDSNSETSGARKPATVTANSKPGKLADTQRPSSGAIVMAKRDIAQGDMIREIDVELIVPQKPILGGTIARSVDSVVGLESLRQVPAGQAVDLNSLRKPVLVVRGQAITVTAKAAGVLVRTTARALDNGSKGDVVLLESLEKKEKYSAVVTGMQQAEVMASGTTVSSPAASISRVGREPSQ